MKENKTSLDNIFYEMTFENRKNFILTSEQQQILQNKVRELNELVIMANDIISKPANIREGNPYMLREAFDSKQVETAINNKLKYGRKLLRNKNNNLDVISGKNVICVLEDLQSNHYLIEEYMSDIIKENYQLLRDLKSNNGNVDILKQIFYICLHIADVQFLIDLTGTYFHENKLPAIYTMFSILPEMLLGKVKDIIDLYFEYKKESERGASNGE